MIETGVHLHERTDIVSGSLKNFSGEAVATFAYLEDQTLNNKSYIDAASGNLIETGTYLQEGLYLVSGEGRANAIAISDDISLLEEDVIEISGESRASSIALSDDISILSSRLPHIGSTQLPLNLSTTGIKFAEIGIAYGFVSEPKVFPNVRSTTPNPPAAPYLTHSVSNTGFYVDFSPSIQSSNYLLDVLVFSQD